MTMVNEIAVAETPGAATRHGGDPDWWRGAVIYQIYPRSFQDSNDDGIGDLKGITQRLPYIAELGVDAIWVSPFFKSPMLDFGYDVSDYRDVDPIFGTLADFDAMIAEAHRLGLKVMIDLVISHTSEQHPWFVESRSSRNNLRDDWYVWADPNEDGTVPNNWLSVFGGSAWAWDTTRCQYYLHNFLASQPDLNLHNVEVQDALLEEVRFWLERGVDGFRLDTINFYFHSISLENNPPLAQELRNDSIAPAVNPYNFQDHVYDKNQPENIDFLKRFRALLDEYPDCAAVGEVGDAQRGLEIVAQYTSGNDKIHMCYAFEFLSPEPLTPQRVRDVQEKFGETAPQGWSCWAFSNHDVMRHASRWADHVADREAYLKMTTMLILSLRGSVCLYQGEELGLSEAVLDFEDLQDPYGKRFWPNFKGRDGCRTPMAWSHNEPNAGFSNEAPWLPVPPEHLHLSVNSQEGQSDSLLEFYRSFLKFRRLHSEFLKGSIRFHEGSDVVVVFERSHAGSSILVAINMDAESTEVSIPKNEYEEIGPFGVGCKFTNGKLELPPFGGWLAKIR